MSAIDFLNSHRPLKLRVEDFLALNDSGAFEGYGKTELLEGEIVYMNAQHRPHARVKMMLYDALHDALRRHGGDWRALTEVTVDMAPHDAPEPDIVVTNEPDGAGPVPLSSIALIVEVADATLRTDMTLKARIYASHGVAEYWVADVNSRHIHQMWQPMDGSYTEQREAAFGDTMRLSTDDRIAVETDMFSA